MRITFLLPGYPWKPVGGIRIVYQFANQLVARGHQAAVVHARQLPRGSFPPDDPGMWLRRRADFIRNVFTQPAITWERIDPRVEMLFVPTLESSHVPEGDFVVATWWATAELALQLSPTKGQKCYFIQHYEVWGGQEQRVNETWRAPLHKLVIARWLYEKGIELGVAPEEITHVPNPGVDRSVFRVLQPIADRPPRVAMMYSEEKWKGSDDGIRALELARQHLPAMQAVLFGVNPRPVSLPRWIQYIKNPPQRVLVEEVYNGSSLYLCPSWAEGWHLPPAEAMACGCAVVSTAIDGVSDYAFDGSTALLAPVGDSAGLAANLVKLLDDAAMRIAFASAGHAGIQTFTWERSTDHFIAALAALSPESMPSREQGAAHRS